MIFSRKTIKQALMPALAWLFLPALGVAQPVVIPGFMSVEMSEIQAPESGMDTTEAYFSIRNLHPREPILLLSVTGGMFEEAVLVDANGETIDHIEVAPGQLFVMGPNSAHVELSGVESSLMPGETDEVTLMMRRGREAMEPVEAEFDASSRVESEAGIPNESEYIVNIDIR